MYAIKRRYYEIFSCWYNPKYSATVAKASRTVFLHRAHAYLLAAHLSASTEDDWVVVRVKK